MRQQGETPGAAGMPVPAAPPVDRPSSGLTIPGRLRPCRCPGPAGRGAARPRRRTAPPGWPVPARTPAPSRRPCGRRWRTSPWSTRRRRPGSGCGRRRCSGTSTSPAPTCRLICPNDPPPLLMRPPPWFWSGAAAAGCPDAGCLERVGQPPGLVHVRGDGHPGELHRDERRPGRPGGDDRLDRGGDLDLDRPGAGLAGRGR